MTDEAVADLKHFISQEFAKRDNVIDERFDAIDQRFETIGRQFKAIDDRFNTVDQRFNDIDQRLNGIDKQFNGIESRLANVEGHMASIDRKFDELASSVAEAIDVANDVAANQFKDHAVRLAYLEHKTA
jgi:archaellum component FlaC